MPSTHLGVVKEALTAGTIDENRITIYREKQTKRVEINGDRIKVWDSSNPDKYTEITPQGTHFRNGHVRISTSSGRDVINDGYILRNPAVSWTYPQSFGTDVYQGSGGNTKSALYQFSMHKDLDGELLDAEVVTVELLNLIRRINTISVWVAMIGLALHEHPDEGAKLEGADEEQIEWFIQEVRCYYPFFPFAVASVDLDFDWHCYEFKESTLILLDLYGTNLHPDDWAEPETFMLERFKGWQQTPFNFIPQGGGSYHFGHRCAGEFITIVVMRTTLDFLVNHLDFEVPEQDFSFEFNDIPAVPNDKVKINPITLK